MTEPLWAKLSYSIGILGVFFGGLLLILRRKSAAIFYVVSILGLLAHRVWVFTVSDRASEAPLTLFLPVVINVLALLVALHGTKRRWIV